MRLQEAGPNEYKIIKQLYRQAFPGNERLPFFLLRRRASQGRAAMLAAKQDGEFIGFAYTVCDRSVVYLFYLAVAKNRRGGGKGAGILRLLRAYYEGKTIFLAREPLDDDADNQAQRISRRKFYLRNGFLDLPYQIREAGVVYDLMSTDAGFDPEDYDALIRKWAGRWVSRFVKMESVGASGASILSPDGASP